MNDLTPATAVLVSALLLSGAPAKAIAPPEAGAERPTESELHVAASLIASETAFVPGRSTQIGVHLKIRQGWHVYWNGRNDTGTPVRVRLTLPDGFKAGEILWPGPVRHVSPGEILDHVYERTVTLLIPIEVDGTVTSSAGAPAKISAHLDWVVCRELCVFESIDTELQLPILKEAGPAADFAKFATARAALPRPWPTENPPARISWDNDWVEVTAPGANWLAFYPYEECSAFVNPIKDAEAAGKSLSIRLDLKEPVDERRLFGVLAMKPTAGGAVEYYLVDTKPLVNRSSER